MIHTFALITLIDIPKTVQLRAVIGAITQYACKIKNSVIVSKNRTTNLSYNSVINGKPKFKRWTQ